MREASDECVSGFRFQSPHPTMDILYLYENSRECTQWQEFVFLDAGIWIRRCRCATYRRRFDTGVTARRDERTYHRIVHPTRYCVSTVDCVHGSIVLLVVNSSSIVLVPILGSCTRNTGTVQCRTTNRQMLTSELGAICQSVILSAVSTASVVQWQRMHTRHWWILRIV